MLLIGIINLSVIISRGICLSTKGISVIVDN
jgi:hypothetical protein